MDQMGMFAKYWEPGRVKTRLAAAIGDPAASRLYRRFVLTLLQRFAGVGQRRVLAYTPAERRTEFESLAPDGWLLAAQIDGDLGQRMQDYFADAFRRGATRVILVGSDSPNLPVDYVNDAFQQLDKYPVVLGPADDGGYYLVGAARSVPPMFSGIQWSSPQVWSQTVSRLRDADCPYGVLPAWYDVDDLASLRRIDGDLADQEALDEPLRRLREDVIKLITATNHE
jgi:rSAM/selenodomain-associated transferase 1